MSSFDAANMWFSREKKSEQIIDDDNTELDMYRGEIHGCLVAHLNRGSQVCTSLFVSLSLSLPLSLVEVGVFTKALIFIRYWKLSG